MMLKLPAFAAVVLLMAACNRGFDSPAPESDCYLIRCVVDDFEVEAATRVSALQSDSGIESVWSKGDAIGVFPSKGGDQVSFTVAEGAGTSTCIFNGQGWGLISSARYSAYYPYDAANYGDADAFRSIAVSYLGQSQGEKGAFGVGPYDFLACTNVVPVFDDPSELGGSCTFNFGHLGALLILDITFPEAASLSTLSLICAGSQFVHTGTVDLSQQVAAITPTAMGNTLSLNVEGITVAAGETVRFYMMAAPASIVRPTVLVTTSSGADMVSSLDLSYNLKVGRAYVVSAAPELVSDGLPRTIHSGDRVLATNETVEQFLSQVHYAANDYSYTGVLDYTVAPGDADMPPSYTIRWYEDASGAITARLWEDGWSRECTLSSGAGNHWVVTNLRPGAHYHYRVSASGGVLAEGEFDTWGHLHQLFFDSKVRNARDLGGWKTTAGKTVRYRKLYRGGKMSPKHLTEAGKQDLLAEGIRAQLDLRGDDKISSCAFGSQYDFYAPGLTAGYLTMLADAQKTKACFEFVVNCLRANKPVYFHCSAGRDRTGTMAMLLLGVLGVSEGDISQEYELSLFAPVGWSITESEISSGASVQTRLKSYKTTTTHFWNLAHGGPFAQGVENYLLSIGVSAADINDFRSLMLE